MRFQLVVVGGPLEAGRVLIPPLSVGRASGNDLELQSGKVARRHCRFTLEGAHVVVEDLGSSNGTWVNRTRIRKEQLAAGDRVHLPDGTVLEVRAIDGTPSWLKLHPTLSQALEDDPDDDLRWSVFADALLDLGDPLGERIARGHGADAAADELALEPLAREAREGNLECGWRRGFMRTAVLRNVDTWNYTWPWTFTLQRLIDHPLAHFLEELDVDILSLSRFRDADLEAQAVLHQLAAARLPLLRRVRMGPFPREGTLPSVTVAWEPCVAAHPRLSGTEPLWRAGRAFVDATELDESMSSQIGPLVWLTYEYGTWWMRDRMPLQQRLDGRHVVLVNGRRAVSHRLRPGDVLEPAPGVKLRFTTTG